MRNVQHFDVAQHLSESHAAGFVEEKLLIGVRPGRRIYRSVLSVQDLSKLFLVSIDPFRLLPLLVHAHEESSVRTRHVIHGVDVGKRLANQWSIRVGRLALPMPCTEHGILRAAALNVVLPLADKHGVQFIRPKNFVKFFAGQQVRGFLREQIIGGLIAQMVCEALSNLLEGVGQFLRTLL